MRGRSAADRDSVRTGNHRKVDLSHPANRLQLVGDRHAPEHVGTEQHAEEDQAEQPGDSEAVGDDRPGQDREQQYEQRDLERLYEHDRLPVVPINRSDDNMVAGVSLPGIPAHSGARHRLNRNDTSLQQATGYVLATREHGSLDLAHPNAGVDHNHAVSRRQDLDRVEIHLGDLRQVVDEYGETEQ